MEATQSVVIHLSHFFTIEQQLEFVNDTHLTKTPLLVINNPKSNYSKLFVRDLKNTPPSNPSLLQYVEKAFDESQKQNTNIRPPYLPILSECLSFNSDGYLEGHVDYVRGWVIVISLGCTAKFWWKTKDRASREVLLFESGDVVVFRGDGASDIEHGVECILPNTCPKEFPFSDKRLSLQFRQYPGGSMDEFCNDMESTKVIIAPQNIQQHPEQSEFFFKEFRFFTHIEKIIFSQLPPETYNKLSVVCKRWDALTVLLWKAYLQKSDNPFFHQVTQFREWGVLSQKESILDAAVVIDFGSYQIRAGIAGDDQPKLVMDVNESQTSFKDDNLDPINFQNNLENTYLALKSPPTTPLLFYQRELTPKKHRESITQISFEFLGVPAFYYTYSVLPMYSRGHTTGILLDYGHIATDIFYIQDGYVEKKISFPGSSQIDNQLKLHFPMLSTKLIQKLKHEHCFIRKDNMVDIEKDFVLPSGEIVKLGNEIYSIPEETYFSKNLLNEIETNFDLPANIQAFLCGGAASLNGLFPKIQTELSPKFKTIQKTDTYADWIGPSWHL